MKIKTARCGNTERPLTIFMELTHERNYNSYRRRYRRLCGGLSTDVE
nr:MAG TPA: hypothetical protein [Caudoviricetes sp.]